MADLSQLRLGTAPDSWGVWFPNDPHQVTWERVPRRDRAVGYVYTELGPQGFMPQDPTQLQRGARAARPHRLRRHRLRGSAQGRGRAGARPRWSSGRRRSCWPRSGAEYLVHLPEQYTDQHTGASTQGRATSTPSSGRTWSPAPTSWRRFLFEEYGVKLVFHPHADTHVDTQERIERFLADTDPELVNLCLDTGHVSYCDGDNIEIIEQFPERITYVHLKSVDPVVRARVLAEKISLAEAVKLGVMCEPPYGEPDMPPLLDALGKLDREIFAVIEQDLYPVEPHIPLPIGARTAGYYVGCGLGPGPALALLTASNRIQDSRSSRRSDHDVARRSHRHGHDRAGPHPPAHPGGVGRRGRRGHRCQRARGQGGRGAASRRHGASPPAQDLIADERVDAVIVCSWGPTHEEYVAGLDRGRQAGVLREAAGHHPRRPAGGSSTPRWRTAGGWCRSASCAATTRPTGR